MCFCLLCLCLFVMFMCLFCFGARRRAERNPRFWRLTGEGAGGRRGGGGRRGFSGRFGGNRHRGGRGWRLESPGRPFFSLLSEGKRPEVSLYLPRAPSDSRPLLVGLARFRLFRRFPAGWDQTSSTTKTLLSHEPNRSVGRNPAWTQLDSWIQLDSWMIQLVCVSGFSTVGRAY